MLFCHQSSMSRNPGQDSDMHEQRHICGVRKAQPACENEANPHNIILNTCGTEDILSNSRAHEKMGIVEKHPSIRASSIPFFNATCQNPRRYDCRNQKGVKRDPTRRLRMQPPLKTEMLSLSTRFTPRQGEHFAWPPHAPACARGQPCSSHAWHPSPPGEPSHAASRPWHGGSIISMSAIIPRRGHHGRVS